MIYNLFRKLFILGAGVYVVSFAVISILGLTFTQDPNRLEKADLIIVHGAGIEKGELMEPSILRAEKAAEAYHAGLAPKLFFTGAPDVDGGASAAYKMAEIAQNLGVPADAIAMEEKSYSTYANLYNARAELGEVHSNLKCDYCMITICYRL